MGGGPKTTVTATGAQEKRPPRSALIVEDHRMLADALAAALRARGFICELAETDRPASVVQHALRIRPGLAMLDLDLGRTDGLELVRPLRSSGARVLVVTGCRDESRLAAAIALGAVGYVSKSRPFEDLLDAAESAALGRPIVELPQRQELVRLGQTHIEAEFDLKARMAQLTGREREIVLAMVQGLSAQAVADRFVVSVGTVRSHIRAVLMKLGVSSQLAAVALVQQLAASRLGMDVEECLARLASQDPPFSTASPLSVAGSVEGRGST